MNEEIRILKSLKYQDEKNNYYSLCGQYGKQIMNLQGKYIVDWISKGAKLSDLCTELSKEFKIEFYQAKEDVFQFLICLKSSKLIEFDEEYFNDVLFLDDRVNIAGEREYRQLVNSIKENIKGNNTIYSYPHPEKLQHYNQYIIRTNSFHNSENYFFEYDDHREKMKNIIGIMGMAKFNTPLLISLMQTLEDCNSLVEFYKELEKKLAQMKKYKIKLSLTNEQINSNISRFIEKAGFIYEARLIREDGIHDYNIYSKLLEG
ncbi:MAG: PqqD family protein [Lachnospiraceae bacterium]|nr:PqqD family protein [Lachnospiraceae bacterium]